MSGGCHAPSSRMRQTGDMCGGLLVKGQGGTLRSLWRMVGVWVCSCSMPCPPQPQVRHGVHEQQADPAGMLGCAGPPAKLWLQVMVTCFAGLRDLGVS